MTRRYQNSNSYPPRVRSKAKPLPKELSVAEKLPVIVATVSVVAVVNVLVVVWLLWGSGTG